ncbi:putative MFS monocarboxylate transporter [Aspergillus cavernicola]|uniref:MFS monocarboxylate transporter n=1 Tax=Aspergillus cavernicola TaxID=176166 RepID=A0ABR4I3B4_9EURO
MQPDKSGRSHSEARNQSNGDPPSEQATSHPLTTRQWMHVLSAFVVFLNTWGLLLTFGAFQTHWEQVQFPDRSSSEISWISTVSGFLLLFSGIITGPMYDYGYLRPLVVAGSLLEVFGLMMVSLSTQYYQVFLSQGICIGLGGGMLYVPSIAAAAASLQEFRRAKFIGLIASATGVGGVIYPVMFRQLLSSVGFPWAVRSIAFVVFATYFLSWAILPYKAFQNTTVRRWVDYSALTEPSFMLAIVSAFFAGVAYYLPLIYLPLFAETAIPALRNTDLPFYLLSIANGASIIGRLLSGLLAVRIGPFETCTAGLAASACLLFCWVAVDSKAGVIAWSVFWGFISSIIVSMPGAMLPLLCTSLSVLGTRTGMYWASVGLGVLVGGPIGGALVGGMVDKSDWLPLQLFAACCMAAGAVFLVYPLVCVRGRRTI